MRKSLVSHCFFFDFSYFPLLYWFFLIFLVFIVFLVFLVFLLSFFMLVLVFHCFYCFLVFLCLFSPGTTQNGIPAPPSSWDKRVRARMGHLLERSTRSERPERSVRSESFGKPEGSKGSKKQKNHLASQRLFQKLSFREGPRTRRGGPHRVPFPSFKGSSRFGQRVLDEVIRKPGGGGPWIETRSCAWSYNVQSIPPPNSEIKERIRKRCERERIKIENDLL